MSLYEPSSDEKTVLEKPALNESVVKNTRLKRIAGLALVGIAAFLIFFLFFFPLKEIIFIKIEEMNTPNLKIKMDDLKVSFFGSITSILPRVTFSNNVSAEETPYDNYISANLLKARLSYFSVLINKHLDADFEILAPDFQYNFLKVSDGQIKGDIDWKNLTNEKKWLAVIKIKLEKLIFDTVQNAASPLPIKMVPIGIDGDIAIQIIQSELKIRQAKLATDIGEIDISGRVILNRTPEFDIKFQLKPSQFFSEKFDMAKAYLEANNYLLDDGIIRAELRGNSAKPVFTFEKKPQQPKP